MKTIIIGTRGSDLAMWQARYLQEELMKHEVESSLKIISTKGDRIQDIGFDKLEGKGFFTKELEDALLSEEVDIAVHSMKDMPTQQPQGLVLGAVSYREDARDVLLISESAFDPSMNLRLKHNAIVGTSSVRRKSQAMHLAPHISCKDIRGNVPTRVQKLRDGLFDAIILAKAGLDRLRLDCSGLEVVPLHPREIVPAPAQGVLAYQCREEDIDVRQLLMKIHNSDVVECTNIERSVLKMMQGGCQIPLGVHVYQDTAKNFHAHASYAPDLNSPLRTYHISQSTSSGMVDLIYNNLISE